MISFPHPLLFHMQLAVHIEGVDMSRGYVCGTMDALNIPQSSAPVVTFWEVGGTVSVLGGKGVTYAQWKSKSVHVGTS